MNDGLLFCAFAVVIKHSIVTILNTIHIVMVLLLLERILVLFSLLKRKHRENILNGIYYNKFIHMQTYN